jgi:hypothetical protein
MDNANDSNVNLTTSYLTNGTVDGSITEMYNNSIDTGTKGIFN